MSIVPSDEKYEAICEKVKKRLRYERLVGFGSILFLVCLFAPVFIFMLFSLETPFGNFSGLVSLFIGLLLGFGVTSLFRMRLKVYYVDDDEWTIYYARPLYINLNKCIHEKTKAMKEDYRKEALKYANNLLSRVQERWTVGTFKPIKEYEKGAVSTFKDNLRYRIIPAIKDGKDELLQKVERTAYNLLYFAQTLTIEHIRHLNEGMSNPDGLPYHKPEKIAYAPRFLGFLRNRKNHLLAFGAIGIVCIVALYGLLVWGLPKESAVSDTLILLGILIGAYVTIQWSNSRQ
jgi:hypothetical protein